MKLLEQNKFEKLLLVRVCSYDCLEMMEQSSYVAS